MKVLFISSGNSKVGISPIINSQGVSLKQLGIEVIFFTINGKGIIGYLKNIIPLKRFFKKNTFDLVHAHYSLSAFVASLASAKPLVVSLMGSDVKSKQILRIIIRLFNSLSWSKIIVKSKDMKSSLGIKSVAVIPNGVDIDKFRPMNQKGCKEELGWDLNKKHILFAANPNRKVKNYQLAQEAFILLQDNNCELKVLHNIPSEMISTYHNAADVVILTSLWEGSPNVIKEAMACNRPIIATEVGDIKELIGNTQGCYTCSHNPPEIALNIAKALLFSEDMGQTNGREMLIRKELDSKNIANRIKSIYQTTIDAGMK